MNHIEFIQEIKQFIQAINFERNISTHTSRAYESDLEHFATFWKDLLTREPIPLLCKTIIERYFIWLYHKKISKNSIARKISCFKSFQRYLKHARGIELEISLHRPRIETKAPVVLTLDEIFFVLDKVNLTHHDTQFPFRDKAILEMLYATGICCSELVNIQLKDIDPISQTIRIVGKRKKERLVRFGSECKKKLDLYITHERIKPANEFEFLFLNYKNEPLTTRSIQRICTLFSSFLDSKKHITPHVLRNSCASHLLQQGVDIKTVQEQLGHATLASTEKYAYSFAENIPKTGRMRHHPLAEKKAKPGF
ncbi:MAG: tyrosine-type recombinase/integrase [Candidatus Babeliaceae bacterium]|nr:tyrosine-type recombinase/integrase [Candidatus Babeliaceae bacterium]